MEENKNYIKSEKQPVDRVDEEQEIDWMEILRKIITIRKTLYKAAGIGLVLGIIIAFSIPKRYTVTVTLSPEINSDGKMSGGLASLASSFLGTNNLNNNSDALNATLSPDIVNSTPFLLELFNIQVQTLNESTEILSLSNYLEQQSTPWWSYIIKAPLIGINKLKNIFSKNYIEKDNQSNIYQLTKEEFEKIEKLKQAITTNVDKKTAITTISVTLQDPKVSAIVADSIINKLQEYIINYKIAKAQDDYEYLENIYKERQKEYYLTQEKYAQYIDANKNIVLQSIKTEQERLQNDMNLSFQIYSQVAQQLQLAKAKIQECKPIFAVIEPATIPIKPSGTSKILIIIGICILSICITTIWILYGKIMFLKYKRILQRN